MGLGRVGSFCVSVFRLPLLLRFGFSPRCIPLRCGGGCSASTKPRQRHRESIRREHTLLVLTSDYPTTPPSKSRPPSAGPSMSKTASPTTTLVTLKTADPSPNDHADVELSNGVSSEADADEVKELGSDRYLGHVRQRGFEGVQGAFA